MGSADGGELSCKGFGGTVRPVRQLLVVAVCLVAVIESGCKDHGTGGVRGVFENNTGTVQRLIKDDAPSGPGDAFTDKGLFRDLCAAIFRGLLRCFRLRNDFVAFLDRRGGRLRFVKNANVFGFGFRFRNDFGTFLDRYGGRLLFGLFNDMRRNLYRLGCFRLRLCGGFQGRQRIRRRNCSCRY